MTLADSNISRSTIKCARQVCKRRSRDPKADGWVWMEFDPEPPKTGWWCPECFEGVQKIMAAHGVTPIEEPLH